MVAGQVNKTHDPAEQNDVVNARVRHAPTEGYRLLAVVGETASGKSALAMEMAQKYDGEIVCADAWTVYRGFDIGSAKPSIEDRNRVPHHLIDVVDATTGFSVVEFQKRANAAIHEIVGRNKLPILVGGSGLYIDSVLYDYRFASVNNRYDKDVLNTMSLAELLRLAGEKHLKLDAIDQRNKRRVVGLIVRDGASGERQALHPGTLIVGYATTRETLQQRVATRVQAMFAAGLEQEVALLSSKYGWEIEAMKGIGYREWGPYFAGDISAEEVFREIETSTMQLAKKQRTWFKSNDDIMWVETPQDAAWHIERWIRGADTST